MDKKKKSPFTRWYMYACIYSVRRTELCRRRNRSKSKTYVKVTVSRFAAVIVF